MTKCVPFVYNICCHCKKRALCLMADTLPIPTLRRCHYAQNLPTQKASEKEGAWFQKENEDCRRQKRSEEKTCKGQKETDLLISYYHIVMKRRMTGALFASVFFPLIGNKRRSTALFLTDKLDVGKLRHRPPTAVALRRSDVLAKRGQTPSPHLFLSRETDFYSCQSTRSKFLLFFTRVYASAWACGRAM